MEIKAIIRKAAPDDGAAMGVVHVEAWRAAYEHIMSAKFLAGLDSEQRGRNWEEAIQPQPNPEDGRRMVAVVDDEIVAIAFVAADETDSTGSRGQLVLINVLPKVWGTGIGTDLLHSCLDALSDLGFSEGFLWVATGNDRARRFYEREGWSADGGEQSEKLGGTTVEEVRYRIRL